MERGPAFLRREAHSLYAAAVAAVDPTRLVAAVLQRDGNCIVVGPSASPLCRWPLPLTLVGAGKPAARMAAACLQALGPAQVRGCVVTADGCGADLTPIEVFEAGHPLPDARGAAATQRILAQARSATGGLLALVGGGASSLLVAPRPPLTLPDKVAVNRALLACGADIHELNTVRKHLSLVKGGGLLRAAPAAVVALLLSDVIGDDPGTIGSGPATADPTTYADARRVLEKYALWEQVPASARAILLGGERGELPETVKPATAEAAVGVCQVLGNWRTAVEAAAAEARRRGWSVSLMEEPLSGESASAAGPLADRLRAIAADGRAHCLLAGGETTVTVRGDGRGGRNQELALALVSQLSGSDWTVLCAGTDGIDGPTAAAGAIVDGATAALAQAAGLEPVVALARNDSYGFFDRLGDSFRPGPTGTNVMDIVIALRPAAAEGDV